MAGVTENLKHDKFYKGDFIEKNPIELLQKNSRYFDYIEKTSATIKYIDNMKDYIKKLGNGLFI